MKLSVDLNVLKVIAFLQIYNVMAHLNVQMGLMKTIVILIKIVDSNVLRGIA